MTKRTRISTVAAAVLFCGTTTRATVFINEILINPGGSADETGEFIELCGTPGKKLDGYAIALLNGTQQKFYPLGTLHGAPEPRPEIDEFFSLDGLALGANGLLVLGSSNRANYIAVVSDTAFRANWVSIPMWNGDLDPPSKLNNDGSNTVLLLRNRPGRTQASPANPPGLRWGKTVFPDSELVTPVVDAQDQVEKDQWGDGNFDRGQPNGLGGMTFDFVGAQTPAILVDDLEIVDEVSYEHDRGWEYDTDDRHVDDGSSYPGLPPRHVHALDDPQGFNPDCLTRVDYRTKGPGWPAAPGAAGELPGGNNWQDTATEQWIRGEAVIDLFTFRSYYDNGVNPTPDDAVQPYVTNVPLWLDDNVGAEYNFSTDATYEITCGRINPLAIPFIPGDADRDGDCDVDDIARIVAVFGDDNWIFSNAFGGAAEGDEGDPAEQTRPWDVDATGSDGIEASDLQWALNFQSNTNGRVIGVRYDTPTPSATGVALNSNAAVQTTVTVAGVSPSGHPLNDLSVGDFVDLTVSARVSAGVNNAVGQQNGIMQFVQDLALSTNGVLRVIDVDAVPPFTVTRESRIGLSGVNGDGGATTLNGYTTSFTQGLTAAAPMYTVRLQAIGLGTTQAAVTPATSPKFAVSTPRGLKVGHTHNTGNPNSVVNPASLTLTVTTATFRMGDCDGDGTVAVEDVGCFANCMHGPGASRGANCERVDFDADNDVDLSDWDAVEAAVANP